MNTVTLNIKKSVLKQGTILFSIFILSSVFRSILGLKNAEFSVFFDEVLHWNIAKSLISGKGIAFRGVMVARYDILYSFFISFANIVDNTENAYHIALVINAILMSTTIFPVYLFARKAGLSKNYSYGMSCFSVLIPEMTYTCSIVQENLMYPMAIWYFVIFLYVIEDIEKNKKVAGLAIFAFLLCLVKDFALAFFCGTVLFFILEFIIKNNSVKILKALFVYIFVFLIFWIGYRKIINFYTYDANIISKSSSIFDSILKLKIKDLIRMIYPIVVYIVATITFWGVFPIIVLVSLFEKLDEKLKNILKLTGFLFLSYIGVISKVITLSENYDSLTIRIHYRYYFFLIIPVMICFLLVRDKIEVNLKLILLLCLFITLLKTVNSIPTMGSKIDCPIADIFRYMDSDMLKTTVIVLFIIFIAFLFYLLFIKKMILFKVALFLFFLVLFLGDMILGYQTLHPIKEANYNKREEINIINNYIGKRKDNQILLLGNNDHFTFFLESYLQNLYYLITEEEMILTEERNSLQGAVLEGFKTKFLYQTENNPQFIIAGKELNFDGYAQVDLGISNYYLYERNGETVDFSTMPVIKGRYSDNWVNKKCEVIFFDNVEKESLKIEFMVDTYFEDEMEIIVTDGTGYSQSIIATYSRNRYEIEVYKETGESKYLIEFSTKNSYIPSDYYKNGSKDTRELSFRLFDINKIVQ